jgi:hypothetical protein
MNTGQPHPFGQLFSQNPGGIIATIDTAFIGLRHIGYRRKILVDPSFKMIIHSSAHKIRQLGLMALLKAQQKIAGRAGISEGGNVPLERKRAHTAMAILGVSTADAAGDGGKLGSVIKAGAARADLFLNLAAKRAARQID